MARQPQRPAGRSAGVHPVPVLLSAVALIVLVLGSTVWGPFANRRDFGGEAPLVTIGDSVAATQVAGGRAGHSLGATVGLGNRLARGLRVEPQSRGRQGTGLTISPQSDPTALREAKLRPGDVLLAVDGTPLTISGADVLRGHFATFDSIELEFERAGQLRKRTIRLVG